MPCSFQSAPRGCRTPGQKWRFRRDLAIYVAHRGGLSQRLLADVFDLPRSRIGAIVARFRVIEADARKSGHATRDPGERTATSTERPDGTMG